MVVATTRSKIRLSTRDEGESPKPRTPEQRPAAQVVELDRGADHLEHAREAPRP